MTIDDKELNNRIKGLQAEMSALESSYNALVKSHQDATKQFQDTASLKRTRYTQLQGAVMALQQLKQKKGNNEVTLDDVLNSGSATTARTPDRVSGTGRGARRNRRTNLGNRTVDSPNPSPG